MTNRSNSEPFTEAGKAVAEQGLVLLDGPDGIAISLTPDAAEETGSSLISAAREARSQNPDANQH